MGYIRLVTGQAGTGKTSWLTEKAAELHQSVLIGEYSRLLAITKMHGARRRVSAKLLEVLPPNKAVITTLDSFALSIVNRWRSSFGWLKPIHCTSEKNNFVEAAYSVEADFEAVARAAAQALSFPTIKRIIAASHPLILIDEFQDCHGSHLELVAALADCSSLLLAADEFQFLQDADTACPAVEWVQELEKKGEATITELLETHRSSVKGILEASRCLRNNEPSKCVTVPVVCCPKAGPMAWAILKALVYNSARWKGSTALISPSRDSLVAKVLASLDSQLKKRTLKPISWHTEISSEDDLNQIMSELGLAYGCESAAHWVPPRDTTDIASKHILTRLQRRARLTGTEGFPTITAKRHVEALVHENRAFRPSYFLRSVLTVHGAKNREFQNVIVLWPYKLPPGKELQRRLLYNAITRAKQNCIVLVLGDLDRAKNDPAVGLLGPARPAFAQKKVRHKEIRSN